MAYYDQIELLKNSLKGYSEEENKLLGIYNTAVKNSEEAHKKAQAERDKQYYSDRNRVYADNLREERNFETALAAKGLGFSGESAQARLNSNVNLSNRLGELRRDKHNDDINASAELADKKLELETQKAQQIKDLLENKLSVNADIAKLELEKENAQADRDAAAALKDKEIKSKQDLLNLELKAKEDLLNTELNAKYENSNEGGNNSGSNGGSSKEDDLLGDEEIGKGDYLPDISAAQLAQKIISAAGGSGANSEAQTYAVNKFLLEVINNYDIDESYYKDLLFTLKAYGYKETSIPFMRIQVASYGSKSVYTKTYDKTVDLLVTKGVSEGEARNRANTIAKRKQMDFILENVDTMIEFRKACMDAGFSFEEISAYRRTVLGFED